MLYFSVVLVVKKNITVGGLRVGSLINARLPEHDEALLKELGVNPSVLLRWALQYFVNNPDKLVLCSRHGRLLPREFAHEKKDGSFICLYGWDCVHRRQRNASNKTRIIGVKPTYSKS